MYLLRPSNKLQKSELDRQRNLHEPSDGQRIALITRLGTASRSAGLNADKLYTEEDMRRMEMQSDLEEPDFTHNDLEHNVDWILANDSNGDFSRDACQFMRRIPDISGCQTGNSDNFDNLSGPSLWIVE